MAKNFKLSGIKNTVGSIKKNGPKEFNLLELKEKVKKGGGTLLPKR